MCEACNTQFFQLRVIDDQSESGATQYDGDFWGLYLGVEEGDSAFTGNHNLPDGNYYMMRNRYGTIQKRANEVADGSDLVNFLDTFRGATQTEEWWRSNLDLQRYYTYRTIIECTHHYDIDDPPGKNYLFFHNPLTGLWSVHPWDMDLTWANNMYGGGGEPFKSRVASKQPFNIEYKNRGREIRDLFFNPDQTGQLIDEMASFIYKPELGPTFVGADRAEWDYNPIMVSPYVFAANPARAYFISSPLESVPRDFTGAIKLMKNYIASRGAFFDGIIKDATIPNLPIITYTGPAGFPVNRLRFTASRYPGASPFAAMKWRIAEITDTNAPAFDPADPKKYEINAAWESPELTTFNPDTVIPVDATKVGHSYRVRARFKDSTGRWSHWSSPVQFVASDADIAGALTDNLRITELMYDPPDGSAFEYVELKNISSDVTLQLGGITFTSGIDYTLP